MSLTKEQTARIEEIKAKVEGATEKRHELAEDLNAGIEAYNKKLDDLDNICSKALKRADQDTFIRTRNEMEKAAKERDFYMGSFKAVTSEKELVDLAEAKKDLNDLREIEAAEYRKVIKKLAPLARKMYDIGLEYSATLQSIETTIDRYCRELIPKNDGWIAHNAYPMSRPQAKAAKWGIAAITGFPDPYTEATGKKCYRDINGNVIGVEE